MGDEHDMAAREEYFEALLRERDERIRKLEEALKAARGTHGELCSDWDNCDFLKLLDELLGEG